MDKEKKRVIQLFKDNRRVNSLDFSIFKTTKYYDSGIHCCWDWESDWCDCVKEANKLRKARNRDRMVNGTTTWLKKNKIKYRESENPNVVFVYAGGKRLLMSLKSYPRSLSFKSPGNRKWQETTRDNFAKRVKKSDEIRESKIVKPLKINEGELYKYKKEAGLKKEYPLKSICEIKFNDNGWIKAEWQEVKKGFRGSYKEDFYMVDYQFNDSFSRMSNKQKVSL